MLETTGYYYKDIFHLKTPDGARRIVALLLAFNAIDK
jgi:hypothetical protein